jgi:LmbE family N-acetylglucosaminyl deacetylase
VIKLLPATCDEVVLLGAHCDDIAIGAGATLLELCRARPGLRVHVLVLCGGGGPREAEERAALEAFTPGAIRAPVEVLDIPDGRLPTQWERAKEALEGLRRRCEPDLVLAPASHDHHQDHRGLALLAPTVFRDHLILGYEIVKADPDLAQPTLLVPVAEASIREKCALLAEHYPSQRERQWFDAEAFAGLARVRGVQCHAHFAEGFHAGKVAIGLAGGSAGWKPAIEEQE